MRCSSFAAEHGVMLLGCALSARPSANCGMLSLLVRDSDPGLCPCAQSSGSALVDFFFTVLPDTDPQDVQRMLRQVRTRVPLLTNFSMRMRITDMP